MVASKQATVSERRALLTDREREIIAGDADVADSYRYQTISRVRARFDRLESDLRALEEHGKLADEFRGIVCRAGADQSPPASARESATGGAAVSGEESAGGASTSQPPGEGETRSTTPHGGESDTFDRDRWRDRLTETVPRSGDVAERRAAAILEMYDHLREHGEAENDELKALVDPDVLDYDDETSVWSNMVKGKDTLRALPGVEKPDDGTDEPWRYQAPGGGE